MKKIISMITVSALALSLVACGNKEADKTGDQTEKKEKLIVATEPGFAPYEYIKDNKVVGVDMDIAQAIADSMGRELEIKQMDFDGALQAVASGKVDFVAAGVSVTDERKKTMDFSNKYVDSTEVVVVNKDAVNIEVSKNDDGEESVSLEGKIIGVQQGNVAEYWVESNAKCKELKAYTQFSQAALDLKNKRIDAIVMDLNPAKELVESNEELMILQGSEGDAILFSDSYAIAVKKGNTELVDQINKVVDQLVKDKKIEEFTKKHSAN